jgi:hypothetical protein
MNADALRDIVDRLSAHQEWASDQVITAAFKVLNKYSPKGTHACGLNVPGKILRDSSVLTLCFARKLHNVLLACFAPFNADIIRRPRRREPFHRASLSALGHG